MALPGVLYLAIKYLHDPRRALIVNANIGGDSCHRGSLLGALLGLAHARSATFLPDSWISCLRGPYDTPEQLQPHVAAFSAAAASPHLVGCVALPPVAGLLDVSEGSCTT